MGIRMVREPSETPNINNTDDIIGLRYAYGNQNGYVVGRGNELSSTVLGNKFTLNSGRVVLQGVESDIDGNGYDITINDGITSLRYVTVYYQVNLDENTTDIKYTTSTTGYPAISVGDDLTAITNGTANLELYHFQIQSGTISEVTKLVQPIEYMNQNTTVENATKVQNVDLSDDNVAQFGDYIVSKKKLLWSRLVYINENRYITVVENMPNPSNKTIEIVMGLRVNDYWWSREKIRWTFGFNNVHHDIFAMIEAPDTDSDGLHWIVLDGRWENNKLSMTAQRYTFNANTNTKTATNRCVSEIYEIIE